ncbi:hypothetical protein Patl1_16764 [Pistacia atlantica]|uniref:Uncharacterized protein n=1 Tax=Pistacia atlantica TaxID=434234 RepID=A0ACC1BB88_9ROSI|nr:hypothetical protein Patl1_16764 [Pistacia atlantica]
MAQKEERASTTSSQPTKSSMPSSRPTITLPPRGSFTEALSDNGPGTGSGLGLGLGFSPGPMTLLSNLFSDSEECKSFSQLLAGAMASPAPAGQFRPNLQEHVERSLGDGVSGGGEMDFRFKHNRPSGLVITQPSPIFAVPPGLSPATLLDSPNLGLFSPGQGAFGMTHQQALAQVTAQAAEAQSHVHIPAEYSSSAPVTSMPQISSFTVNTTTHQQIPPAVPDSRVKTKDSSDFSQSDQRPQSSFYVVDKPADDLYNWRKYGQKQVKGSEFPRSYYKCTRPNCPVKKKVERSLEGQITEIIYKGQHNHQPPQSNKRSKDPGNLNGNSYNQGSSELASQYQSGNVNRLKHHESSQATPENVSGTSDSEEVEILRSGFQSQLPHIELLQNQELLCRQPVKLIFWMMATDGANMAKKVVKGNPYPRSYYKCTFNGCNVRKHVERASTDPKAVITTYEGKHNHDVPAAKTSSHNTANSNASQIKPQNAKMDFANNSQQPIARLRLKEEHLT